MFKKWVLLLLSLFLIVGCHKSTDNDTNNKKETDNTQQTEEIMQSRYPGVDKQAISESNDMYNLHMQYPVFHIETLDNEIKQMITSYEDEFKKGINTDFLEEIGAKANLNINFNLYSIDEGIYSIQLAKEANTGGANPDNEVKTYLVDLNSKQFINRKDLFELTDDNKSQLVTLLEKYLGDNKDIQLYIDEDSVQQIVTDGTIFDHLLFTKDGLQISFEQYEIAAGAAGEIDLTIPYNEIEPFLSKQGEDLLKNYLTNKSENKITDLPTDIEENKQVSKAPTGDLAIPEMTVDPNKKRVAITFDDGPNPETTLRALDILDKYEAKATFFMVGSSVQFYPDIVKEVLDRGHEIGNHTWDHKDLTTLSDADIKQEINATSEAIYQATGKVPATVRPPYGAHNDQSDQATGLPIILWTVDTRDWESHDPKAILQQIQNNTTDSGIILMHDVHATTIDSLDAVLGYLKDQEYQFVTVSHLND